MKKSSKRATGPKAAIPVTAVDFVMHNARDLKKLRSWYQKTFGFRRGEEWHDAWSEFATEPVSFCLNGPAKKELKSGIWTDGAVMALAVPDVVAAAKACRRRKIPLLFGPIETKVCWLLLIKDPEGNRIVLHQRKDGTAG
jgi:predicted enzyme related to lactoylglutathione lyase